MNVSRILMVCIALTALGVAVIARAEPTHAAAGGNTATKLIEPAEAAKLIAEKKVVVLDVRMAPEFAKGHIAGATNLDFYDREFKEKLDKLDKNQPYLVHCAVGMRSAKACKIMNDEGFKTIYDLQGGLTSWKKAGLSLER